jgi:hypothetical protein
MSAFHDNALMGASGSQGYQISRSVRLRSSASAYFNRTQTAGSQTTWTWSGWVKRGKLGTSQYLMQAGGSSGSGVTMSVIADDFQIETGNGTTQYYARSTAQYRDPSAWYHVVMVCNTTSATSTLTGTPSDRLQIWVNGVQVTSFSASSIPTQNFAGYINQNTVAANIGRWNGATPNYYFDGYLTEINFIDGQALTPSSFGETDAVTGVWKPKKYAGTYGTNGFYLNFSDNSATTATTIGKDYSGNGNNWTPNNISVTSGVTYDSMLDVPTQWADGGNGRGNYAVMNPLAKSSVGTLDNANMRWTCGNSGGGTAGNGTRVSIGINSGKWYAECTVLDTVFWSYPGISNESHSTSTYNGGDANSWSVSSSGQKVTNNSASAYGSATWAANDIVNIAYDADNGELYFGKNGTWLNSGNPATRTNPAFTGLSGTQFFTIGFSSNTASTSQVAFNCGQQPFTYTPPSGFKALNTFNLPEPTIKKGNQYFDVVTRTTSGTSGATISSLNFKPDLIWSKLRNSSSNHYLWDSVRGASKYIHSNLTNAEGTDATFLASFNSNGYTMGATEWGAGNSAVEWCLNAGSGTSSSNTNGSITSTVSVNATAGFSVVSYTGNYNGSTGTGTVGHGLGVAPKMIIVKNRSQAFDWGVGHASIGWNQAGNLNLTNSFGSSAYFNSTAPTSSVFSVGLSNISNQNSSSIVAYCFAEVAGYSKFGSYTGNGSSDGPFVYLGFRPRWILLKRTDSSFGGDWEIWDTSRSTYNAVNAELYANSSSSESSATNPDILSNGFKIRSSAANYNASGGTYVYACFAENPYKLALAR